LQSKFCGELANIRKYLLQNKFAALKTHFVPFVLAKFCKINKAQISKIFKTNLKQTKACFAPNKSPKTKI